MQTLVTGGAGFIGSHLVHALVARGHTVRIVDDLSAGHRHNLEGLDVDLVVGDIRDTAVCDAVMADVEVVFHLAALNSIPRSTAQPDATFQVNVDGTWRLMMAARAHGARRFIYASSSSIYGDNPLLPRHESHLPSPMSVYAASKAAMEDLCRGFGGAFGLPVIGLRYFNVFGPRQDPDNPYAAVVPLFVRAALQGRESTIFGDGTQTRDFTFVDNAVAANLAAMDAGPEAFGRAFNVATGHSVTVNELHAAIQALTGAQVPPRYVPSRPGDQPFSQADVTVSAEVLGYTPRVSFEQGLQTTVAWFRAQLGL